MSDINLLSKRDTEMLQGLVTLYNEEFIRRLGAPNADMQKFDEGVAQHVAQNLVEHGISVGDLRRCFVQLSTSKWFSVSVAKTFEGEAWESDPFAGRVLFTTYYIRTNDMTVNKRVVSEDGGELCALCERCEDFFVDFQHARTSRFENELTQIREKAGIPADYLFFLPGFDMDIFMWILSFHPDLKAGFSPSAAFHQMLQGRSLRYLTQLDTRKQEPAWVDDITGTATFRAGGLQAIFKEYGKGELTYPTWRLLNAFRAVYAETNAKDGKIKISLRDYMELCGLSDEKETRAHVKREMENLKKIELTSTEVKRGKNVDFLNVSIYGGTSGIRNSIIYFKFNEDFLRLCSFYSAVSYPALMFRLNSKHNPNSYCFLSYITDNKHMNAGKANEDIVSVKSLLNVAHSIPRYEKMDKSKGEIRRKIIYPFMRDMNALEEVLTYAFCYSGGEEVAEDVLDTMDYHFFSQLMIKITWRDYPDQTKRLEHKQERKLESGVAPKKRGRPAKQG